MLTQCARSFYLSGSSGSADGASCTCPDDDTCDAQLVVVNLMFLIQLVSSKVITEPSISCFLPLIFCYSASNLLAEIPVVCLIGKTTFSLSSTLQKVMSPVVLFCSAVGGHIAAQAIIADSFLP